LNLSYEEEVILLVHFCIDLVIVKVDGMWTFDIGTRIIIVGTTHYPIIVVNHKSLNKLLYLGLPILKLSIEIDTRIESNFALKQICSKKLSWWDSKGIILNICIHTMNNDDILFFRIHSPCD
jgi:hypothetical protein